MDEIEEEFIYEQKMDKISFYLEELILNAILSVLKKLKSQDEMINRLGNQKHDNEDIPF